MTKKNRSKKTKKNKGFIVADEGANRLYVSSIRSIGFDVIELSPEDKNRRAPDNYILRKYCKGRYPMFTSDKGAHIHNPNTSGATGFVFYESVEISQFEEYTQKIITCLGKHTSRTLRGKKITIKMNSVEEERM